MIRSVAASERPSGRMYSALTILSNVRYSADGGGQQQLGFGHSQSLPYAKGRLPWAACQVARGIVCSRLWDPTQPLLRT